MAKRGFGFNGAARIAMGALAVSAGLAALPAVAATPWVVQPRWVAAHEAFLASDALAGRGSATRDEAITAAYVASEFQGYGLKPAPGMAGYLQTAVIITPRADGPARLTIEGAVADPAAVTLLSASGRPASGPLQVVEGDDPKVLPASGVVLIRPGKAPAGAWVSAARRSGVELLILRADAATAALYNRLGGHPAMSAHLEGDTAKGWPNVVTLAPEVFDQLAARPGAAISLTPPPITEVRSTTTNAIGFLQGRDPNAGVLLLTAHLDHLGVRPDGVIMHGANDDASGTTAVLELAHALASGAAPRRSILFVCYGSEEMGEHGSHYFAEHPPVPLSSIVANLEFEMIGAQDPKLPPGTLMMTGYDRSNFGPALKAHGGLVTDDPYPSEHFFERSDNYQLALAGVVAHTVSGWAVTPTYHTAQDDLAHLNLEFMTRAIQSLVEPMRWLADSDFRPAWNPGQKPVER
jgi:aminopeptidase YwaD